MIDENIQAYADRHTSDESELLLELREKTFAERSDRSMLSGFYQGRLLSLISKLIAPRRVLEIGTYMGYSALCLAEGLAPDGRLITLDIAEETNEVARRFWARSPVGDRIESRLGDAREIIPTLDDAFDLVFIDADKENYVDYYELVFPKLRTGSLILADNVLWSGKVLDAAAAGTDANAAALAEFNRRIQADDRAANILLTVRDGLMMIRKEKD